MGHNCTGHNYTGHNYIPVEVDELVGEPPELALLVGLQFGPVLAELHLPVYIVMAYILMAHVGMAY